MDLEQRFRELFGGEPRVYRAPGRVNLIGEHTDYNDGFVMPVALTLETRLAAAPRGDRRIRVHSENQQEITEVELGSISERRHHWSDYVVGIALTLESHGVSLRGADLLVEGHLPAGAGLASSAALQVAVALALTELAGVSWSRKKLARLCRQAESDFVGIRCGIMDPYVCCFAEKNHALMLDCRTLEHCQLPLPSGVSLVVCNSMVSHRLVASEYNQRRRSCEQAVAALKTVLPEVRALCDLSPKQLERHAHLLEDTTARRARHVVGENRRVQQAAAALSNNDLRTFGALMIESHRSLRHDYEVSCDELDLLVALARDLPGVYGTRMTGGGFGGCTVSLVAEEQVSRFCAQMSEAYEAETGRKPQILACQSGAGAGRL